MYFHENGNYTDDDKRTVYTNNMANERNVKIKIRCNQVDGDYCYLKSNEFPDDKMCFGIRIGRGQWWNDYSYGDIITVPDTAEEIGVRVEVLEGFQEMMRLYHGVEFSANITIVREVSAE